MTESISDPEGSLGSVGLLVEQIVQEAAKGDAKLDFIELDDDNLEDGWTLDEQAYDADILKIESESIDLTQDDEEEEINRPLLSGPSDTSLRCQHYMKGTRNPCLCGHHEQVSEYWLGDTKIRKKNVHGLSVEVRVGRFVADFVEIEEIWVHRITDAVLIRGLAYTRTRNLDGRLQAYKNEVCRLVEIDTNDDRPVEEQSLIEVAFEDLHPKNRVLHITNKSFPECRFDPDVYSTCDEREKSAPLTARWIHIMQYPDKRYRRAQRPIDGETLAHLMEDDVFKTRHRASDIERLRSWRGDTSKGGSYVSQNVSNNVPTPNGQTPRSSIHKYNAADMFSGAGGYTSGAKRAGIKVVYALDHWARCNATYKANHPEVKLQEQDIMTYCNDLTLPDVRFDLVHLSPPCQTWSPAHTCAGKNDSANIAALYACTDIIFRYRPRIFTFEQTFGIIQERHLPWFNALVQSLTKHGYSLTWKVIRLVEYGLPQTRKRLIMIGAAPGEKLPPFPSPTHAAEPSPQGGRTRQKRFVSAVKACWGLVPGLDLHDPLGVKQLQRQPWDGNQPMNRTITTSGGQAYHWDGERDLTLAEFARLQGFPDSYVFKAPCIKKQIGNAFPPTVVHAIMKQIVHSLEQVDNVSFSPREEDIVHIEEDEDEEIVGDEDKVKLQQRRGEIGELFPQHKREPEPDYPDYPGYFEDINYGLSEEDAMMAAIEESRQIAASLDDSLSAHRLPSDNKTADFQEMKPAERVAWASQVAQRVPTRRSSSRGSRRRSSGGSSVVCIGQRQLPTIIKDEEHRIGEGRYAGSGDDCVKSQGISSSATYCGEDHGVPGSSTATCNPREPGNLTCPEIDNQERDDNLLVLEPVVPPSSPTAGTQHNALISGFLSVPKLSHWSHLHSQAQFSITGHAAASSSSQSTAATSFDVSQWQDNVKGDEALVRAMRVSISEAVQHHEEKPQEAEMDADHAGVSGVGLDLTNAGESSSGCASFQNPFGPLAHDQWREDSEGETYEGKGKGKAIVKRGLDGADDSNADNGSPPKRGRIEG
ncbi:hypothetical protein N0V93_009155 [Gnomoniopsis smithogilvyi]|uniref:DNA (cytosine-5-)-methyltransferase n=1 Tax=Gnomoniopsis smithogilvyi TaxID=1191159 RepID=A0A9W9CTF6_9PEZI|nr:hypothetical protein N0V93_009155 [Gnomoniopsis smithogilvyi]